MQVEDLVTGPGSTAERIAEAPFNEVFYSLSSKCDGCLYNEFCMKDSFEQDDLTQVPYLQAREKQTLRSFGITTAKDLAALKEPSPVSDGSRKQEALRPAPGQEGTVRGLSSTTVGPRMDELVLRARSRRREMQPDASPLPPIQSRG